MLRVAGTTVPQRKKLNLQSEYKIKRAFSFKIFTEVFVSISSSSAHWTREKPCFFYAAAGAVRNPIRRISQSWSLHLCVRRHIYIGPCVYPSSATFFSSPYSTSKTLKKIQANPFCISCIKVGRYLNEKCKWPQKAKPNEHLTECGPKHLDTSCVGS